MNVKKINWQYRGEFNLKEDRDFVLQCIKNGNGVLRFNKYSFNVPGVGSNKGGLQEEYNNKKDFESVKRMYKEWHPFVSVIKKEDRIDLKIKVKELAKSCNKIVK